MVEYAYDAWGNVLDISGTYASTLGQNNPIRYRGYYYDSETSLYYLNSRYYDSNVGRFLNADVYLTTGQGMLGYNMFAYCCNNPIMNCDPTGEFFISMALLCITAGAIIGAGVGAYAGTKYAQRVGVDDGDIWKYTLGGALGGAFLGGIVGVIAAPAITTATGIAGISVTSTGITAVGVGSTVAANQVVEGVYYHVTSHQAAQQIADTGKLIPSPTEGSVCVLNFQPTLEQAKQLGSVAYDTVIQFKTTVTTFIADTTVPFSGAYRNMVNGAIKIFEIIEVGFK